MMKPEQLPEKAATIYTSRKVAEVDAELRAAPINQKEQPDERPGMVTP